MFFYIRSISSTRYISTFFSNIPEYSAQKFSSRELLKCIKPRFTSEFFIENGDNQISQEIRQIPYTNTLKEQLIATDNPIYYNFHKSICINDTRNLIDTYTKDKIKFMNYTISKNALNIRKNSTHASVALKDEERPSTSNLDHVYNTLCIDLPNFFAKSMDYRIYSPKIEFINNIKGSSTIGLANYIKQFAFLRILGHLKFAYVKVDILKITKHSEDNSVRIRWRIVGKSAINVLYTIWKHKVWKMSDNISRTETWYDGFSIFYVGEDGLVFKHIADKMMIDNDSDIVEPPKRPIPSQLSFSTCKF